MKIRHIAAVAVLASLLSLPAAAQDQKTSAACSQCKNTINAAAKKFSVVMPKVPPMSSSAYDDIGCAVIARNNECATRQMTFDGNAIAHDYLTSVEVPVEAAYFVLKTDVSSPRGYGIVAFRNKGEAEKFSAEHGKGKVIRWFELVDENLK